MCGRAILEDFLDVGVLEVGDLGSLERARAGAVRGVIEKDPFAKNLACAEGRQALDALATPLLDGHAAGDDDPEQVPGVAFLEDGLVGLEHAFAHAAREVPEILLRKSREKRESAQAVSEGGRHGR